MHILLIRFSSMGDVVLQTATINWLKSLFGNSLKITFLTSKEFSSCVDTHPMVDEVITFDRKGKESFSDLINKIKTSHAKQKIDLILDAHATLRSFRLKCTLWMIPSLTVDKRRWERFLLTKFKWSWLKRFISTSVFGLENQVERILNDFEAIFGDHRAIRRTKDFVKSPGNHLTSLGNTDTYQLPSPYIVVSPSASFKAKRWPVSSYVNLVKKVLENTNYHVAVLAGPADDFCDVFNEIKNERFHNLQGKTSLKESMSILANSLIAIGNDSGMNHIAEAYGRPCITIFGATDSRFGFAPHGAHSRFIEKELSCRPCSTTGSRECYRERHFCMELISVDEVYEEFLKIQGVLNES